MADLSSIAGASTGIQYDFHRPPGQPTIGAGGYRMPRVAQPLGDRSTTKIAQAAERRITTPVVPRAYRQPGYLGWERECGHEGLPVFVVAERHSSEPNRPILMTLSQVNQILKESHTKLRNPAMKPKLDAYFGSSAWAEWTEEQLLGHRVDARVLEEHKTFFDKLPEELRNVHKDKDMEQLVELSTVAGTMSRFQLFGVVAGDMTHAGGSDSVTLETHTHQGVQGSEFSLGVATGMNTRALDFWGGGDGSGVQVGAHVGFVLKGIKLQGVEQNVLQFVPW